MQRDEIWVEEMLRVWMLLKLGSSYRLNKPVECPRMRRCEVGEWAVQRTLELGWER